MSKVKICRRQNQRREVDRASTMIEPGKLFNAGEVTFIALLCFGIGIFLGYCRSFYF